MDRKMMDKALEAIDQKYIQEVLRFSSSENPARKENENMKIKHLRPLKIALIAACICLALAVTVSAAAYILYDKAPEMLESFFGKDEYSSYESYTVTESGVWQGESIEGWYTKGEPFLKQWEKPAWNSMPISEEMKETLSRYVYEVNKSVTLNGYTLTVEACTYSQATDIGMLYYTLENPDGVGNYEVSPKGEVLWTDPDSILVSDGSGFARIDSANTTDTKLCVCYFFVIAEPRDTNQTPDEWGEMRPALRIKCADKASEYIVVEPYDLGIPTISAAEGNIQLCPFGMLLHDLELGLEPYSDFDRLKIIFKDGSEYVISDDEAGVSEWYISTYCGGHVKKAYISLVFNRVIDPNDVASIVLEGVEYPLD